MSGPKAFSHTVVASTRRSWAAWEKRAIVDEAQRATSSISAVVRRHGITPSLLFRWRRELRQPGQSAAAPPAPAYDTGGELALQELTRKKPLVANRTAPEIETLIVELSLEQPAFGQIRLANEIRQRGHSISPAGVRGRATAW